jgi:ribose transport system ATP-binding protein
MATSSLLLSMRGVGKEFPGVRALEDVDFEVLPGEVHALVGENGAGKSTLMKILSGALQKDEGEILLDGQPTQIASPHRAQELGIAMIYQEFNLVPHLSAAENIFLGREPRKWRFFVDWKKMHEQAGEALARLGVGLDLRQPVRSLSVAQRQMVEIAKALSADARLIVMDEPSATLTEHELERLFQLVRSLKQQGVSVVYISHRLEEIFEVADRVTVLRDGKLIGTSPVGQVDRQEIIRMMVGHAIEQRTPKKKAPIGEELLRVEGLSGGPVKGVSLSVRKGEIVCLTGLVGSGRTELARLIFGADPRVSGTIYLDGRPVQIRSPREAIRRGIGFVTEDRKEQGLILGLSVRENVTLANLDLVAFWGVIRRQLERASVRQSIEALRVRTPSMEQLVRNLSGGNQQKVVLAKWLFTKSKVLLFDEPTRGIDVGAKVEIYQLMNELAARGVGMLMITSELPEALGMSDRILVMHAGKVAAELRPEDAAPEKIMFYATGGH